AALEALRQPVEDGRVSIVRANHSAVYPSRFMLIAATNPCPRAPAGVGERCRCAEADLARHRRRLSGPLLDRIDVLAHLASTPDGARGSPPLTSSLAAREQVRRAPAPQIGRLRDDGARLNAHMDARAVVRHVQLEASCEQLLDD